MNKATLKHLRTIAHSLKPVVRLGQNGYTEAVVKELDGALEHHELVKIKLSESERRAREQQLNRLCDAVSAECVQQIGHTATLFRRNTKKPVIELPKK